MNISEMTQKGIKWFLLTLLVIMVFAIIQAATCLLVRELPDHIAFPIAFFVGWVEATIFIYFNQQ